MPLTILTDEDVRTILHSLTKHDILDMQQSLADALHYYSTSVEEDGNACCSSFQPKRSQLKHRDGSTTLFMPASSNDGIGVKIVTLAESSSKSSLPMGGTSLSSASSNRSSISGSSDHGDSSSMSSLSISEGSSHRSSLSGTTAATSISSATGHSTPGTPTSVKMPGTESGAMATSANIAQKGSGTSPTGSLTLLNSDGTPTALINAAEITAFRTALATTMLFKKRPNVHDVVIFGAGKQAYWHARLALLLRGSDIHHLNIINRSFENAYNLIHALFKVQWPVELYHPKIAMITPAHNEYERLLKSTLRAANVIFCTTPSTTPLFPPEILTSTEGRKKGRFIAAIGSYQPHMCELHPDIIRQAVAPHHHHHFHKHAATGGAIIVDTVEGCLKEAGELIQAGLGGKEVVELGELVMLKREAERARQGSHANLMDKEGVEVCGDKVDEKSGGGYCTRKGGKGEKIKRDKKEEKKESSSGDSGLREWLEKGNVIYKSVGLGLMDVVVGGELVRLAREMQIGTRIDNF